MLLGCPWNNGSFCEIDENAMKIALSSLLDCSHMAIHVCIICIHLPSFAIYHWYVHLHALLRYAKIIKEIEDNLTSLFFWWNLTMSQGPRLLWPRCITVPGRRRLRPSLVELCWATCGAETTSAGHGWGAWGHLGTSDSYRWVDVGGVSPHIPPVNGWISGLGDTLNQIAGSLWG